MIGFYDFDVDSDDSLTKAVRTANALIDEHGVDVVNIETVIVSESIKPTPMASLVSGAGAIASSQCISVWYRAEKSLPPPSTIGAPGTKSAFTGATAARSR